MKNNSAQKKEIRLATAGQIKDLCAVAVQGIPAKVAFGDAEAALLKKERLVKHIQNFFRQLPTELPRNLAEALAESEAFTRECFGLKNIPSLSKLFVLPEKLPYDVFAAFVPAGADYRDCVNAMKKARKGLAVYEEEDVNKYSNSQAVDKSRLYLIERSERPNKDTMGLSPDKLIETGKTFLGLGPYAVVMGQYHMATGKYLDLETWTWFPKDRLLDKNGCKTGEVANGDWRPDGTRVGFGWSIAAGEYACAGARLATEVPLKS